MFQNGTPLWEDFIAKATKLHSCLRYVYFNFILGLLNKKISTTKSNNVMIIFISKIYYSILENLCKHYLSFFLCAILYKFS